MKQPEVRVNTFECSFSLCCAFRMRAALLLLVVTLITVKSVAGGKNKKGRILSFSLPVVSALSLSLSIYICVMLRYTICCCYKSHLIERLNTDTNRQYVSDKDEFEIYSDAQWS